METVLLVIHLMLAVALIGIVLMQKSEGGGLGIGGGGGGMSGFMTGRGTANLLTRTTTILAACFMATSLALAWLVSGPSQPTSILDTPAPMTEQPATEQPAGAQPSQEPAAPATQPEPEPAEPSVPLGQ